MIAAESGSPTKSGAYLHPHPSAQQTPLAILVHMMWKASVQNAQLSGSVKRYPTSATKMMGCVRSSRRCWRIANQEDLR